MPDSAHFSDDRSRNTLVLRPYGVSVLWRTLGLGDSVAGMEAFEAWTLDNPASHPTLPAGASEEAVRLEIESVLAKLEGTLNTIPLSAITAGMQEGAREVVAVMGAIRAGRALALLRWIGEECPSALPPLLELASQNEASSEVLYRRLTTLERQRLLSRVFSQQRADLVRGLLQDAGFEAPEHAGR